MSGRFIAIVGPSGVGKDSVMAALAAQDPRLTLARRMITRPSEAGGEDFDGVSEAEFLKQEATGGFALHWQAHGLCYGIPAQVDAALSLGMDVLANLSRAVLLEAVERFSHVEVILLKTNRQVLSERLHARGRESAEDIARRLERADFSLPQGVNAHVIDNSGTLQDAIQAILQLLYPQDYPRVSSESEAR
jgi:ribose 1,5-bisphosphokinase